MRDSQCDVFERMGARQRHWPKTQSQWISAKGIGLRDTDQGLGRKRVVRDEGAWRGEVFSNQRVMRCSRIAPAPHAGAECGGRRFAFPPYARDRAMRSAGETNRGIRSSPLRCRFC